MKTKYERNQIKQTFYNGYRWRRCRKAFAESKCWICELCGNRNIEYFNEDGSKRDIYKQLQVHHKDEILEEDILNGNNEKLYGFDNLQLLCLKCHDQQRKGDICAKGYELIKGRMVKKC